MKWTSNKEKLKIKDVDTALFNRLKERDIFVKFTELFEIDKPKYPNSNFKKILYKELPNGEILAAEIREGIYDNNQVFERWGWFNINFYSPFLESIETVPNILDKEGYIAQSKEDAAVWNRDINDPEWKDQYSYTEEKLNEYNKKAIERFEYDKLYRSNFIECGVYSYDELKEIVLKCIKKE
jgi:hypothetical protein